MAMVDDDDDDDDDAGDGHHINTDTYHVTITMRPLPMNTTPLMGHRKIPTYTMKQYLSASSFMHAPLTKSSDDVAGQFPNCKF